MSHRHRRHRVPSKPVIVSPQGAGPPLLVGTTLPTAIVNSAYSTTVSSYAFYGVPPYTFALVSETGGNTYAVSSAGAVTGTITAGAETDTILVKLTDSLSRISEATFLIPVEVVGQVATPTFSPVGGTYAGAQTVTISCST